MKFLEILPFCIVLLLLVSACKTAEKKEPAVEFGKTITFDYAAGFDNGTLYDTSFEDVAKKAGIYNPDRVYEPITIIFNKGSLFPGLEEALLGMKADEIKNIRIPPNKAYGVLIENSTAVLPKASINNSKNLKINDMVTVATAEGKKIITYVKRIGEENITLDLNHPLAGNYIQFSIILRSIK